MTRKITFERAKAVYSNRYTMEHVPPWARTACEGNGRYYAPQYRTDAEWYANTTFPGESEWLPHQARHCESNGQTWPLGRWLDAPYKRERSA